MVPSMSEIHWEKRDGDCLVFMESFVANPYFISKEEKNPAFDL